MKNEEVYDMLKTVQQGQLKQAIIMTRLEANQGNLKEQFGEMKSDFGGMKGDIEKIKEIDIEQTASLKSHMKRSKLNEDMIDIVREEVASLKKVSLDKKAVDNWWRKNRKNIGWIIVTLGGSTTIILALIKLSKGG